MWNHVYHTPAAISEEVGVDRVIVTLPNDGHKQDVKAMLKLYDNPEELTFPDEDVSNKVEKNSKGADKVAIFKFGITISTLLPCKSLIRPS